MPRNSHSHAHGHAAPAPTASQMEAAIKAKFTRLEQLRTQIAGLKNLYTQHDALMGELLEMFVQKTPDMFIVKRTVIIGNKVYRFSPSFYDEQKNQLKSKVWKSAAFPSGTIES